MYKLCIVQYKNYCTSVSGKQFHRVLEAVIFMSQKDCRQIESTEAENESHVLSTSLKVQNFGQRLAHKSILKRDDDGEVLRVCIGWRCPLWGCVSTRPEPLTFPQCVPEPVSPVVQPQPRAGRCQTLMSLG
jgi:hypothetical protein